ncbi:MAG: SDR family oxidoreductase [Pseudomonadales bacterium]|mgnify:FL=1|jgi:NAD(P)-dependent dehydrogenase (short-subunit alcohol dehydrogenase family)|nr:SDR family oxidoreductase [Gammaproteobacteria bacterium]MBP6052873.1 SDR family oxidoreductase [Pseudomonadales bacterium]MBK6582378.1 SDR family oxidoreductase [Gammaproteobacteria bacterium]MBK7171487.1 SDR family oxidoreductase [Gammaproteobacteria bacterium]MBK8307039.1 SDR family oxidoreductase [Gammaproteobacteria bacterium]
MDFNGKTLIVTGAGGGIGECYAKVGAARGMNVVIAELSEQGGSRVAEEIDASGGSALFVRTDVASEASARACADAAMERFGRIDYLINNAAIFGDMRLDSYLSVDMDYLEKFMRVNAHGCLIMTRAVVEHMSVGGGGSIINQSSTAAWMGVGFYGVAKLAMNGITQSLARELGPRNIRINALAPGPTDTGALQKTAGSYAQEMLKTMPIGRLGQPQDLADAALFLLSDESRWITGHVLNVDGGQFMRP